MKRTMSVVYCFHMPAFFFISGFLEGEKRRSISEKKQAIVKKAKRLMVPYFFLTVVTAVLKLLFGAFARNPLNYSKVNIKSILRKTAYGYKAESSSYIEHLRSIGMKIGSDCIIYVPTKTLIDEQYPWMITTWYGMTYHEDVAAVKDSFKKMLKNGVYKADLFSDL